MTTHDPRIHAMRWCSHYGRRHLWLGHATACGRNPRSLYRGGDPYCTTCLAYAQGYLPARDKTAQHTGPAPAPASLAALASRLHRPAGRTPGGAAGAVADTRGRPDNTGTDD